MGNKSVETPVVECRVDGCFGDCPTHSPKHSSVIRSELDTEAISYATLEAAYTKATVGNLEPNVLIVNPKQYAHIKSLFQSQAVFTSAFAEFSGLKFNNATIVKDPYAPGDTIEFLHEVPKCPVK